MTPRRWIAALACLQAAACSGCLLVQNREEILRKSEERRPVRFQSGFAQRTFQQKAVSKETRDGATETHAVSVPLLFLYRKKTAPSDAALFNDQLAACDLDADGFVSDDEAMAYAGGTRIPTFQELQAQAPDPTTPHGDPAAPSIASRK